MYITNKLFVLLYIMHAIILSTSWGTNYVQDKQYGAWNATYQGTFDRQGHAIRQNYKAFGEGYHIYCRTLAGSGGIYMEKYMNLWIHADNNIDYSNTFAYLTGNGIKSINEQHSDLIHLHDSYEYYPLYKNATIKYLTGCGELRLKGFTFLLNGYMSSTSYPSYTVTGVSGTFKATNCFTGSIRGDGAFHTSCGGSGWAFNGKGSDITTFKVISGKTCIGWNGTGSLSASKFELIDGSVGIGDNNNSKGEVSCTNALISGGSLWIGAYGGNGNATGICSCSESFTQSGGSISIGCAGSGSPGTGKVSCVTLNKTAGDMYIGYSDNAASKGTLTVTQNATVGGNLWIGNGKAFAIFKVGGVLTANGNITCNNSKNTFTAGVLSSDSGKGVITLNNDAILVLNGKQTSYYYRGKLLGGTLKRTANTGWGLNTVSDSSIDALILENGNINFGWSGAANLYVITVDISGGDARLIIGDNSGGNGSLTCSTLNFSNGKLTVGAYNGASGSLSCLGTITQTGGVCAIGNENNANYGTGSISASEYLLQGGSINIATYNNSGSRGSFKTSNNLEIFSDTIITIGNGNGKGSLNVDGTCVCDGTINCNALSSAEGFKIYGLDGSGNINLKNATKMTISHGNSKNFSGLISGGGGIYKTGGGYQILSNSSNNYTGETVINNGTLCGYAVLSSGWSLESNAIYRLSTSYNDGNSGGITRTAAMPTGTGIIDLANGHLTITEVGSSGDRYYGKFIGKGDLTIDVNTGQYWIFDFNTASTVNNLYTKGGSVVIGSNANSAITCASWTNEAVVEIGSNNNYYGKIICEGKANVKSGSKVYIAYRPQSSSGLLTIADTCICDGTIYVQNLYDDDSFQVAGLSGNGKIVIDEKSLQITNGKSCTFSGDISGPGGVVKSGDGYNILTGNNTYFGPTTINSGMLCGAVSSNSSLNIIGGIYRLAASYSASTDCSRTLNGSLTGSGTLDLAQGTLILNYGSENLFNGTIIGGGTLSSSNANGSIRLNTKVQANASPLGLLKVDGPVSIGYLNNGALNVLHIQILSQILAIGQGNGGIGIVTCEEITLLGGNLYVGSERNSSATLTCTSQITQTGASECAIGGNNNVKGVGIFSVENYTLTSGSLNIGAVDQADASGKVIIQDSMTLGTEGTITIGSGKGKGSLFITNTLNCDGTINCNKFIDERSFSIGHLAKAGTINLNNNTLIISGSQEESIFSGRFLGGGTLICTGRVNWGCNCKEGSTINILSLEGGHLNLGWKAQASLAPTTLNITGDNSRLTIGEGLNGDGALSCTRCELGAGNLIIGTNKNVSGLLICSTFNQTGGSCSIGHENGSNPGRGSLETTTYKLTKGELKVATCNSVDGVGSVLVSSNMEIGTNGSVLLGTAAKGSASFLIDGTLVCHGILTEYNAPQIFKVGNLSGLGNLIWNHIFQIVMGSRQNFTGTLNGGNLKIEFTQLDNARQVFNTSKTPQSYVQKLDINATQTLSGLEIGYNNASYLKCGKVLITNGVLWVGEGKGGYGELIIEDSLNSNAQIVIGYENGSGEIIVQNNAILSSALIGYKGIGATVTTQGSLEVGQTLTHTKGTGTISYEHADDFIIGAVGTGEITCKNFIQTIGVSRLGIDGGRGSLTCKDKFTVSGGEIHLGNDVRSISYGVVTCASAKIDKGQTLILGYPNNQGGAGDFVVTGVLENNGHIICNRTTNFKIGQLLGTGEITLCNLSTFELLSGANETFSGQIMEEGQFIKEQDGVQILTGENTYIGGTDIRRGTVCGNVSFEGDLNIDGTYRLSFSPTENSGGLERTLKGALSGNGTLDLVDGHLAFATNVDFAGEIRNSHTTYTHEILDLGPGVQFNAGTKEQNHLRGIITTQGAKDAQCSMFSGNFPGVYWQGCDLVGTGGINAAYDVYVRGISNICHLTGARTLFISYGYELTDFSHIAQIYYAWNGTTNTPRFTGSITKQGNGRQILQKPLASNYVSAAPTHTGITCVEGGILAGPVSPTASLQVGKNGMYQITCYNTATHSSSETTSNSSADVNITNILSQTVKGINGEGTIEIQDSAVHSAVTLCVDINTNVIANFDGQLNSESGGIFTKKGAGTQNIRKAQPRFKANIILENGALEIHQFDIPGYVILKSGTRYKMLGQQTMQYIESMLGTNPSLQINGQNLILRGQSKTYYGTIQDPTKTGSIILKGDSQSLNTSLGSTLGTLSIDPDSIMNLGRDTNSYLTLNKLKIQGTVHMASGNGLTTDITSEFLDLSGIANLAIGNTNNTYAKLTIIKDANIQSNGILTIGQKNSKGLFKVSGTLTNNGRIICNTLTTTEGFMAGSLTGSGEINMTTDSLFIINGNGNDLIYTGNVQGRGTLRRTHNSNWGLNCIGEDNAIARLEIAGGKVRMGWKGKSNLVTEATVIESNGFLSVGDGVAGNATLQTDTLTLSSGIVAIGCDGNQSSKGHLVSSTIVQKGGQFFIGCLGSQSSPGYGVVECDDLTLERGEVYLADYDNTDTYGELKVVNLDIKNTFTKFHSTTKTRGNAKLIVKELLTCDCKQVDLNLEGGATIGGLGSTSTNGQCVLYHNTVLTITDGLGQIFKGKIISSNGGSVVKQGKGSQIFSSDGSSYTAGTIVEDGIFAGYISFNGSLTIHKNGQYRLVPSDISQTGGLKKSLLGQLSGEGVLDLADGCLTLNSNSIFEGDVINSNTNPHTTVLQIGESTKVDMGSHEHQITGTINMLDNSVLTGDFPHCYWKAKTHCGINVVRDITFRGLEGGECYLSGDHVLIITEGYADYSQASLCSDELTPFCGSIVKKGKGRQILTAPTAGIPVAYTGDTDIEEGVLAGRISPLSHLHVAQKGRYQICCYEGPKNHTGIQKQTIQGVSGEGEIDLEKSTLDLDLPADQCSCFDGQIIGKGCLQKTGNGCQILTGDITAEEINVDKGSLRIDHYNPEHKLHNLALRLRGRDTHLQVNSSHFHTTLEVDAENTHLDLLGDSILDYRTRVRGQLYVHSHDHILRLLGGLEGDGSIIKDGSGEWIWDQVRSEGSSANIKIQEGKLTLQGSSTFSEKMSLELTSNSKVNLNIHQTLRKITGSGEVDLHHNTLAFNLMEDWELASKLLANQGGLRVKSVAAHVVRVSENVLEHFSGLVEACGATQIILNNSVWPEYQVRLSPIDPESIINIQQPALVQAIAGAGRITGTTSISLQSHDKVTFDGDLEPALYLEGKSVFYWHNGPKNHTAGLFLKEQSQIRLAPDVQLSNSEIVDLEGDAQLWLNSDQTISKLTGKGTVHLDDHNLIIDLSENMEFTGDITGNGVLIIRNTSPTPHTWTWTGNEYSKMFTGTVRTEGNIKLVMATHLLNEKIKIPFDGAGLLSLSKDQTFSGDQLHSDIYLNGYTATIAHPQAIEYPGWITGPGNIITQCPESLTFINGLQPILVSDGKEPSRISSNENPNVIVHVEAGSLELPDCGDLPGATIYLEGTQLKLKGNKKIGKIITRKHTSYIHIGEQGGEITADLTLDAPLNLHATKEVIWVGDISGGSNLTKIGNGKMILQGNELIPRIWLLDQGTLTGHFNNQTEIRAAPNTKLSWTTDQTLYSLNANNATMKLNGHTLTLNQNSIWNGQIADYGAVILNQADFTIGMVPNLFGPITLNDGTLTLTSEPNVLCVCGIGTVRQGSHHLTLEITSDTTFDGTFQGTANWEKTGEGKYILSGAHTIGPCFIRQGILYLPKVGRLDSTAITVEKDATLAIENGESLPSPLSLINSNFEIRGTVTLSTPLTLLNSIINTVDSGKLTTTQALQCKEESSRINKIGLGIWSVQGQQTYPFQWIVSEGTLDITGELEPSSCLQVEDKAVLHGDQTLQELTGAGTVETDMLILAMKKNHEFAGILAGEKTLNVYGSNTWTWGKGNSDDRFKGALQITKNCTVHCPNNLTLHQLTGLGALTVGEAFNLQLNHNCFFEGSINASFWRVSGPHQFTWKGHHYGDPLTIASNVKIQNPVQLGNVTIENGGTLTVPADTTIELLNGNGTLYSGETLNWKLSNPGFAGDLVGTGTVTVNGNGSWHGDKQSFTGKLVLESSTILHLNTEVLLKHCLLNSNSNLYTCDQTFSNISGNGKIVLEPNATLTLRPDDSTLSFAGDIENGTVRVESGHWNWNGGAKTWHGSLIIENGAICTLAENTTLEGVRTTINGIWELLGAHTISNWSGAGIIQHTGVLTLKLDPIERMDFDGDIKGHSPINITGAGTLYWNHTPTHQGGLSVAKESCLILSKPFNPAEPLDIQGTMHSGCDQTLNIQNLTGNINIGAYTLTLPLLQDYTVQGTVTGSKTVCFTGTHSFTIQNPWPDFTGTIHLLDSSHVNINALLPPTVGCNIDSPVSSVNLAVDLTLHDLSGIGILHLNEHTLSIKDGTFEWKGSMDSGTLCLDHAEGSWSSTNLDDNLVGQINIINSSNLNVYTTLCARENLNIDESSRVVLHSPNVLDSLKGQGDIQFTQQLYIEDELDWGGTLTADPSSILTIKGEASKLTRLSGDNSKFKGTLNISDRTMELFSTCRLGIQNVDLNNASIHWYNAKNLQAKIIARGETKFFMDADMSIRNNDVLVPVKSTTTWDTQDYDIEWQGGFSGQGHFIKRGAGTCALRPTSAQYRGLIEILEGTFSLIQPLHASVQFEVADTLHIKTQQICSLLSGQGTVSLDTNARLCWQLQKDSVLTPTIQGGTFQVDGNHALNIEGRISNTLLEICSEANVQVQSVYDKDIAIQNAGTLTLPDGYIAKQISNTGTLTWGGSLTLNQGNSIWQGDQSGEILTVSSGSKLSLHNAIGITQLHIEGEAESKGLDSTDVTLKKSGFLDSSGTIKVLNWAGILRPVGENSSDPYGKLALQEADIQDSALLWIKIGKTGNSTLELGEVKHLEKLQILLDPIDDTNFSEQTFTLITSSADQVPQLSRDYGLGALYPDCSIQRTQQYIFCSMPRYTPKDEIIPYPFVDR